MHKAILINTRVTIWVHDTQSEFYLNGMEENPSNILNLNHKGKVERLSAHSTTPQPKTTMSKRVRESFVLLDAALHEQRHDMDGSAAEVAPEYPHEWLHEWDAPQDVVDQAHHRSKFAALRLGPTSPSMASPSSTSPSLASSPRMPSPAYMKVVKKSMGVVSDMGVWYPVPQGWTYDEWVRFEGDREFVDNPYWPRPTYSPYSPAYSPTSPTRPPTAQELADIPDDNFYWPSWPSASCTPTSPTSPTSPLYSTWELSYARSLTD
jgi:hypothetical protein